MSIEELTAAVAAEGEAAISDTMASRALALNQLLIDTFPPKELAALEAEFAKSAAPSGGKAGVNAAVVKLTQLVREQAAISIENFKAAEMWIQLKAPACSDGNNFGVEVQQHVLEQMKAMRHAMVAMMDAPSTYHWQRGLGLEKVAGSATDETSKSESTSTEKDGDKSTSKSSSSSSTSTKSSTAPDIADFVKYVVAIDVKQHAASKTALTDMRNCHLRAIGLLEKNFKRLADPRGEGESGNGGNVMSMF